MISLTNLGRITSEGEYSTVETEPTTRPSRMPDTYSEPQPVASEPTVTETPPPYTPPKYTPDYVPDSMQPYQPLPQPPPDIAPEPVVVQPEPLPTPQPQPQPIPPTPVFEPPSTSPQVEISPMPTAVPIQPVQIIGLSRTGKWAIGIGLLIALGLGARALSKRSKQS